MDLSQRLPGMSDAELTNLSSNAQRLGETGTESQRLQAVTLLPLVKAEIDARKVAKLAEMRNNRPVRPARTTKSKAAAAAAAAAEQPAD
ncbi:MAG TPA: hypothetical protein VM689_18260 [Aliidongia sp.]|nr:hypothetical protein [Aliidongia sp.]